MSLMAFATAEERLSDGLSLKITPKMRLWLEGKALPRGCGLNVIVREYLEAAMHQDMSSAAETLAVRIQDGV